MVNVDKSVFPRDWYKVIPQLPVEMLEYIWKGYSPKDFMPLPEYITGWMILFLIDNEYMPAISELSEKTFEVFQKYCDEYFLDERPKAVENIRGYVDLFPCCVVLVNNTESQALCEFCEMMKFTNFPYTLAIRKGKPIRQIVGSLNVDRIREFLDRTPGEDIDYNVVN